MSWWMLLSCTCYSCFHPVLNLIWDDPQHKKPLESMKAWWWLIDCDWGATKHSCPRHILFVVCVVHSDPTKRSTWKNNKQQPANNQPPLSTTTTHNNNNNNNNNKKHNPHVHINHHHPHQSKPLRRIVRIEGSEALRPMSASSSPATPRKCLLRELPAKNAAKNAKKTAKVKTKFTKIHNSQKSER